MEMLHANLKLQEIIYECPICIMNPQNSLLYYIPPTNYNAGKYNMLLLIPFKDTYLQLFNRIHKSIITEVISNYPIIVGNLI